MSLFSHSRNQHGMALVNVAFIFMFLGVLITAGIKMYGPIAARQKATQSKSNLDNQAKTIVAWAVKNPSGAQLPKLNEFNAEVFGADPPLDGWGRPVTYLYDANLAVLASGGLCGKTTTALSYQTANNVAFLLLSGGENAALQSTLNGTLNGAGFSGAINASGPATGAVAPPVAPVNGANDISRFVTLYELQAMAGCFGPSLGYLRIVNNELPNACAGSTTYPATLFADGGAGAAATPWTLPSQSSLPWNPMQISSTGVLSPTTRITSTLGTYQVTAQFTDSNNLSAQRTYPVAVGILGSCSAPCQADPACAAACKADPICSAACAANPACVADCPSCVNAAPIASVENPVTFNSPSPTVVENNWNGGTAADQGTNNMDAPSGKFDMVMNDGTLSAISVRNGTTASCIWFQAPLTLTGKTVRSYLSFIYTSGEGFVVAMVPSLGRSTINSCDENAAMGFGSGIPGNTKLGAEFYLGDPPDGTTCITVDGSQCTGSNNWVAGTRYYVRIELDASVTPNPVYKVWVSSNSSLEAALSDITTDYVGGSPSPITRTLSSTNISDLSSFFLGFTTSQHGNDKVNMTVSGLKFVLD